MESYGIKISSGGGRKNEADRFDKRLPAQEIEFMRIRIIAAHSGTGKSYLAKLYPEKYRDFICMPYKYRLSESFNTNESESCKANPDNDINRDYPHNYIKAIKNALIKTDKTLIIPSDSMVLRLLKNENIPYLLCYPENTVEAKEEYRKRYIARGNSEDFLRIFVDNDGWENFMNVLKMDDYGVHIVMKPSDYLSDIIEPNKEIL